MRVSLCFCLCWCAVTSLANDLAGEITALTGTRTKFVWMRGMNGHGNAWNHPGDNPNSYRLMVFDTAEGKERELCPGPAAYSGPQINYDGTYVFYTQPLEQNIYRVEFATGKSMLFCRGSLCCLWRDPQTEVEYVVYGDNSRDKPGSHTIFRSPINDPSCVDVLMDLRQCESCAFRLSADGTVAGGAFNGLGVGVVLVPEGRYLDYQGACNSCLAPDNSYALWHMVGSHNEVVIKYEFPKPEISRTVLLNKHAKLKGLNVWNPAWSNHIRFMTLNGPWPGTVHTYAPAHLWLCRFNEKLDDIEQYVQISDFNELDFEGRAWIQPKELPTTDGVSYMAGISARNLTRILRTLPTADRFGPTLEALRKSVANTNLPTRAREAQQVIAQLENWGQAQFARARDLESTFPPGAEKIYRELDTRFDGHAIGTAARQALQDAAFQQDLKLWPLIEQMHATEKQLKELPGARHSAVDEKFAATNAPALATIRQTAAELARQTPSARIQHLSDQVLVRCEILPRTPVTRRGPAIIEMAKEAGWPGARQDIVFMWERKNKPVTAFEADGTPFQAFTLDAHGLALIDRNYAMAMKGGYFSANKASAHVVKSCRDEWSMEAYVAPENLDAAGPATILAVGGNLALGQEKNKLVLCVKTPSGDKALELCTLERAEPFHLIVSYQSGKLRCYRNGKEVFNQAGVAVEFGRWTEGPLVLGALSDGQCPWRGALEGVVLYRRVLEPEDATRNCAAYLERIKDRKPPNRIELQAKLVAAAPVPTAQQIAPYRNALIGCDYEVEKVLSGTFEGSKIHVAVWGMLDEKPLEISKPELGKSRRITVELYTDNPQLQNEDLVDPLPDALEATLYYDVTP